jgi:altronate hydrolase
VLVLGLGCENNNIAEFKKVLGDYNPKRVKFLNAQESQDDIAEGIELINQLKAYAEGFKREAVPVSKLRIGLKCGGSDGLSGITANPLIGRISDRIIAMGGACVLSEVPEMFGAETILMNRCENEEVFECTVGLINNFKDYFTAHNQVIYENPSPGNKAGGISTLEEKSLGCTQKGGRSIVTDVLDYGDTVRKGGLNLLNGPGNDMVAVTNLTACGCQLILFSTGRGTPLGAPIPTIKISTNTALSERKPGWIDFNAGEIINGKNLDDDLFNYVLSVSNGALTANERNGYKDIAIFKDGVTL